MRIAVVALSERKNEQLIRITHAVAREFKAIGQECDVVIPTITGLSGYDYLVFCSDSASMATAKNDKISHILANAGTLVGKRSMVILLARGFLKYKKLSRVMSLLEREGLVLTMAELITNEAEAANLARSAPLVRG
jgi:hypothetical protein